MATNELAKAIADIQRDKENMKSNLVTPGSISSYFLFPTARMKVTDANLLVEERTIGTAWIWGHTSNAIYGTSTWGAGTLGSWSTVENITTDQALPDTGKNEVRNWLASVSGAAYPTYVAFGNDNTAFTEDDTALGNELKRLAIESYSTSDKTATIVCRIVSTDSTLIGTTLKEVGLYNASASGDMITRRVISDLTTVNTKEYRFTFTVTFVNDSAGDVIVTDAGLNLVRDWFTAAAPTQPSHIAWGTGSTAPDASDTTLEGEQERNAFITSPSRVLNKQAIFEAILATTEANSTTIRKSGVFNDAATGTLLMESRHSPINKTSAFQIQNEESLIITAP